MLADNQDSSWSVPQALQQAPPRSVRLTWIGILYSVLSLASFAFGGWLTARLCIPELHRQAAHESLARRLDAEGRETEATVTGLVSGMAMNRVFYSYIVDGRSYKGGANLASEHWQALQVGATLAIRYLPSDPAQTSPVSDPPNSRNNWPLILPLLGIFLGFPLLFGALFFSFVWPQRRLLAGGDAARGVVTRCRSGSRRRMSGYFLYYEFPLPDGSQCRGRDFSGQPAAEGSTVTVLYDSRKPLRNALYPMETVKLAAI